MRSGSEEGSYLTFVSLISRPRVIKKKSKSRQGLGCGGSTGRTASRKSGHIPRDPCTVHPCKGSISHINAPSSWRFRSKRFLFFGNLLRRAHQNSFSRLNCMNRAKPVETAYHKELGVRPAGQQVRNRATLHVLHDQELLRISRPQNYLSSPINLIARPHHYISSMKNHISRPPDYISSPTNHVSRPQSHISRA